MSSPINKVFFAWCVVVGGDFACERFAPLHIWHQQHMCQLKWCLSFTYKLYFISAPSVFLTETGILFGFWLSNFALELSNSFRNIHCIPVYIISIWPMFCAWQIWSCRRIRTCGPCCIGLKKIWITETVRMYVKVPLYCYLTFPEVIGFIIISSRAVSSYRWHQ